MGQRSAIVMFVVGGGLLIPMVILGVVSPLLGRFAVPTGFVLAWVGFACLVTAKWRILREGKLWSWGTQSLSARGRRLYWLAYALITSGLFLAAITPISQ